MECIENRVFDEIRIGDSATTVRTLTEHDIELFAVLPGNDTDPAHAEEVYATDDMLHQVVAPSLWGSALISWVIGTRLPGPGSVYQGHSLHCHHRVTVGDVLKMTVKVTAKSPADHSVTLDCLCVNQRGEQVLTGTAWIEAPMAKICSPPADLPLIYFGDHGARHKKLVEMASHLEPVTTAVVHPVDELSLKGAVQAAEANLIVPLLVGPSAKIWRVAESTDIDITPYEIVDVAHSHHAAARAVELVRQGRAQILMKGSLHTDELMEAVVRREGGLRTERRVSHVFIMDVPTYPRLLHITDAAINIEPDLMDKRDIVQNAIELAHVLGVEKPKVAILSAVETVTPKLRATTDAAALCKMADRGQISGGILDGPLAFDNAISKRAAMAKGIDSPVAGEADILVVPDLEAGNMIAKQLEYLAGATAACIALGAQVPIVLTSRADNILVRIASCAVAVLMIERKKEKIP